MKRFIFIISAVLAYCVASAQEALNDIKANMCVSGSNYLAYPGPHKQLTPAPKGYKPYYITHYGSWLHRSVVLRSRDCEGRLTWMSCTPDSEIARRPSVKWGCRVG